MGSFKRARSGKSRLFYTPARGVTQARRITRQKTAALRKFNCHTCRLGVRVGHSTMCAQLSGLPESGHGWAIMSTGPSILEQIFSDLELLSKRWLLGRPLSRAMTTQNA